MAIDSSSLVNLKDLEFEVVTHGVDNFGQGISWELHERVTNLIKEAVFVKMADQTFIPMSFGKWLGMWLAKELGTGVEIKSLEMVRSFNPAPTWDHYQLQIRYVVEDQDKADASGTREMFDTVFPK